MYQDKINDLFASQLESWPMARNNYESLKKVKLREIDFGKFRIMVQFNPGRIRSSAAKVDRGTVEARPCFLCSANRPKEQKGVPFENSMTVLVNPFPIFQKHLTIPSELHTGQRIEGNFGEMLTLAMALPGYTVFYNGPSCGASAPDHLHFQAGNRGFLPVECDFESQRFTKPLSSSGEIKMWTWSGYQRGIVTLKSSYKDLLIKSFYNFYGELSGTQPVLPEPMMNILSYWDPDGWVVHIIPRKLHRPAQYFAEGDGQILLSPASVDLGGVLIVPREEDFLKINHSDISDIFAQVCFSENELSKLFK